MNILLQTVLNIMYPAKCSVCKVFSNEIVCGKCMSDIDYICRIENGAYCVAAYIGTMKKAVKSFKFRKKKELGDVLGMIISGRLPSMNADIIIPVPLHRTRMKERGFNQSELLALSLSRCKGLPVIADALIRVRETRPQFELHKYERENNVRGAFEVTNRAAIQGKRILLLDDICTTGSTIKECTKTLLENGAVSVASVCLTRAVEL